MVFKMLPKAYFHNGIFRQANKRDLFAEYGSLGAVDVASTLRNHKDSGIVSQLSGIGPQCQGSLCASVPCLPLLDPVFGEEDKKDCCGGVTKEIRQDLQYFSASNYNRRKCAKKIVHAKKVVAAGVLNNSYSCPKDLVCPWMIDAVDSIGNKLEVEPYCPPVNSAFTGGCLSNFNWPNSNAHSNDGMQYLCYSGGVNQEEIVLASVHDSANEAGLRAQLESMTSVSSRIKQMCSSRVADKVFIGVRCHSETHIFCGQEDEQRSLRLSEIHQKRWGQVEPTSIALSEYVPGEALITTNKRSCFLVDHTGGLIPVVKRHKRAFHSVEPWHHSQFGSHPRQVLMAESTSVTLYDIRGQSVSERIFSVPHEMFHPLERITVCSPYKNNSCYYVLATQMSLVLADIRFPYHPVLHWSHNLPSAPAYLSVINSVISDVRQRCSTQALQGSAEDVILLGSQEENEVQAFQISGGQPPPVKTRRPLVLSRPRDMTGFGMVSTPVEPLLIEKRLNSSFCGLTGMRRSSGDGFTAFTISAMGDIFYQTFTPDAIEKEKSWRHGPGSENLKVPSWAKEVCTQWTSKIQQYKDNKILAATEIEAQDDITEKYVVKQSGNKVLYLDSSQISMRKELPHVLCWLCMRHLQNDESEHPSRSDQSCCACQMSIQDGCSITQTVLKDNVMHKPAKQKLKLERQLGRKNLKVPKDPYSQILLKLWEEDEPDLTNLVEERERIIKNAVERKKMQKETTEYEEDFDVASPSHTPPQSQVGRGETDTTIEQHVETEAVLEDVNESERNDVQRAMQESDNLRLDDSIRLPSTPDLFSQPYSRLSPRRQRRLSVCSNASVSSVQSTGSQGFLATPKRLLQRSRQSSPCPSVSTSPYKGILSSRSTPVPNLTNIVPSLIHSLSQSGSPSLSVKRKATPSSTAKKKHRMGF